MSVCVCMCVSLRMCVCDCVCECVCMCVCVCLPVCVYMLDCQSVFVNLVCICVFECDCMLVETLSTSRLLLSCFICREAGSVVEGFGCVPAR